MGGPRYVKMIRDSDGWLYPADWIDAEEFKETKEEFGWEYVWVNVLKREPQANNTAAVARPGRSD